MQQPIRDGVIAIHIMESKGKLGDVLSSWGGGGGDTHTLTWNTVILEFQGAVVSTYFHVAVYRAFDVGTCKYS